jgi:hypothetical protein
MWFAFVLSSVLAAAPQHERAPSRLVGVAKPEVHGPITRQFPGAIILSEADFASTVGGRSFLYRDIGSGIVIHSPGEFFGQDGRYSFGHRAISRGTYSFKNGIVSIKGTNGCFIGLGHKRIFFRHQGRLLTSSADGGSSVFELILRP